LFARAALPQKRRSVVRDGTEKKKKKIYGKNVAVWEEKRVQSVEGGLSEEHSGGTSEKPSALDCYQKKNVRRKSVRWTVPDKWKGGCARGESGEALSEGPLRRGKRVRVRVKGQKERKRGESVVSTWGGSLKKGVGDRRRTAGEEGNGRRKRG